MKEQELTTEQFRGVNFDVVLAAQDDAKLGRKSLVLQWRYGYSDAYILHLNGKVIHRCATLLEAIEIYNTAFEKSDSH